VINESASDKMIRELKEENNRLRDLLIKASQGGQINNLEDLGLSADDLLESLNHAEQEVEEREETNFEQKLAR